MTSGARGAAGRAGSALRASLGDRYRRALRDDTPGLTVFLAGAAALDAAARTRRAARDFAPGEIVDRAVAATRHGRTPTVRRVELSAAGDLSVVLAGPPDVRSGALGIVVTGPSGRTALETSTVHTADAARLVARVGAGLLTGGALTVAVTDGADGTVDVPVVVGRRAALGAGSAAARFDCGPGRCLQLVPRARDTGTGDVVHRVVVGLTGVDVRWAGPDPVRTTLRLSTPDTPDVLVPAAAASGGESGVRVELAALVGDRPRTWTVDVGAPGGTWAPLRRPVDALPEPGPAVRTLVRANGRAADVRVVHGPDRALQIRVGGPR